MAEFDASVGVFLALLFLSSMGEAYFPDIMVLNGMGCKANYLFIADALGNLLAAVVPTQKGQLGWLEIQWKMAFVPCMADIFAKIFLLGGIALASAQTKSILYNSCIVWSALISKVILGRVLTLLQWSGVAFLIIGCIVKIDWNKGVGEGSSMFLGTMSILIGCVLHSLTNVVNEHYIRKYSFPPAKLCSLIGAINLSVWCLVFAIGFLIPELLGKGDDEHWVYKRSDFSFQTLKTTSSLTPLSNGAAWIGFIVSSAVHAVAYFNLLGSIGVVSCGVMKGLTTAGYVTLSAIVFCSVDKKFCLKEPTVASALICISGVMLYSYATAKANSTRSSREIQQEPSEKSCELPLSSAELGTSFKNVA